MRALNIYLSTIYLLILVITWKEFTFIQTSLWTAPDVIHLGKFSVICVRRLFLEVGGTPAEGTFKWAFHLVGCISVTLCILLAVDRVNWLNEVWPAGKQVSIIYDSWDGRPLLDSLRSLGKTFPRSFKAVPISAVEAAASWDVFHFSPRVRAADAAAYTYVPFCCGVWRMWSIFFSPSQ